MHFTVSQDFRHYHSLAYIALPPYLPIYFPSLERKEVGLRGSTMLPRVVLFQI